MTSMFCGLVAASATAWTKVTRAFWYASKCCSTETPLIVTMSVPSTPTQYFWLVPMQMGQISVGAAKPPSFFYSKYHHHHRHRHQSHAVSVRWLSVRRLCPRTRPIAEIGLEVSILDTWSFRGGETAKKRRNPEIDDNIVVESQSRGRRGGTRHSYHT